MTEEEKEITTTPDDTTEPQDPPAEDDAEGGKDTVEGEKEETKEEVDAAGDAEVENEEVKAAVEEESDKEAKVEEEKAETSEANSDDADAKPSETENNEEEVEAGESKATEEEVEAGESKATEEEVEETKDNPEEEQAPVITPTPKRGRGRPPKSATTPGSAKSKATPKSSRSTRKKQEQTPISSVSKRQRRVAKTFEPANFKEERLIAQTSKQYAPGRGDPLSTISAIKVSINKIKGGPIMDALYKFIFGTMGLTPKGKAGAAKMKTSLMEFSGFLPVNTEANMELDSENPVAEEVEKERKAKDDEIIEKFETKASEMTDALLKSFCDVLHLQRTTKTSKQEKINLLIEFLAEPSPSLLKQSQAEVVEQVIATSTETRKRRGRPPKDKTAAAAEETTPPPAKRRRGRPKKNTKEEKKEDLDFVEDEEMQENEEHDDDDKEEIIDGVTIPSAKQLRKWVNAYVTCFDLDKCNAKHAIQTASEKFKVDLNVKKNVLMEMLKDAIV